MELTCSDMGWLCFFVLFCFINRFYASDEFLIYRKFEEILQPVLVLLTSYISLVHWSGALVFSHHCASLLQGLLLLGDRM